MERKGIINLFRSSLLIHMLYLTLLIILFFHQRQIQAIYMPAAIDKNLLLSPYIIVYDIALFIAHTALIIVLERKLSGSGTSISYEVKGSILFGVGFFCMDGIGYRMIMQYVGSFHGDSALACYMYFRMAAARISPIRMIAVTMLFVAVGMAVYCKLACRKKATQRRKSIIRLLRGALALDAIFVILVIIIVIFQNRLKVFFRLSELEFIVPGYLILSCVTQFVLHVVLTVILVRQLLQGRKTIVYEILGLILYSGVLGWLDILLNYRELSLMAMAGIRAVTNYSNLKKMIDVCFPIQMLYRSMFIICCGMLIYKKLHGKKIVSIHGA